jgi:hypothetical protein
MAGPGTKPKLPSGRPGMLCMPNMASQGKQVEEAVLDHLARAALAFFGRLEHQVQRAVEVARGRQVARRAQQHGGVAVVAAGVHLAGTWLAQALAGWLDDGQRVHVGAQAQAARAVPHTRVPTTPVPPRPRCTS